jgi:hypothetical protein
MYKAARDVFGERSLRYCSTGVVAINQVDNTTSLADVPSLVSLTRVRMIHQACHDDHHSVCQYGHPRPALTFGQGRQRAATLMPKRAMRHLPRSSAVGVLIYHVRRNARSLPRAFRGTVLGEPVDRLDHLTEPTLARQDGS